MTRNSTLRRIRNEFDYKAYLESHYDVKYVTNGELRICCPSCGDYRYKLYVNNSKKLFQCFRCGFSNKDYDVFDFIALTEQIPRGKAILFAVKEFVDTAPDWEALETHIQEGDDDLIGHVLDLSNIRTIDSLPSCAKPLTEPARNQEQPFWEYLTQRGLLESEIKALRIHYVAGKYAPFFDENHVYRFNIGQRCLIPVYGGNHKLVGWIGRSIDPNSSHKYLNSPDSDFSKTFWPYVPAKNDHAILVEGIFDALAVRRAGFSAYATFGKKISHEQIRLLKSWNITNVTLFWDKRDAVPEMKRAIEELKLHFTVTVPSFVSWPEAKDAGDALADEDLLNTIKNILTEELIQVDTWEYIQWLTL